MKNKKKNRLGKIVLSSALIAVTFLGACAQKPGENLDGIKYATASEVEFWGAYATEKIMQDNQELYENSKLPAVINLETLKGETEGYQIIMSTGEKPVDAYDVRVSDLFSENDIFSAENISVAHEKYLYLGMPVEYYTTIGYYPDALVPFENIKQNKENKIAANNNQGLYINFTIPENQAEGTYTGVITITIGGENKNIPVRLKVGNVGITSETHVKSIFLNSWFYHRGELDTTQEMYDKYQKFLFKYRCGTGNLLHKTLETLDSEIEYYAQYALEYSSLKECPSYCIPVEMISNGTYVLDGETVNVKIMYNQELLEKYLTAIAYIGIENNVDTLKKAVLYGYDEPDLNGISNTDVFVGSHIIKQSKLNVAEKLRADTSIENTEMMEQIIDSMIDIPHIVTQNTFLTQFDLDKYDFVYCPEFHILESKMQQDKYRMEEDNELWWYGCLAPRYPYPTYHIDDTLVSARLLSWMQADYNIQGNLYWGTTAFNDVYSGSGSNVYPYIDDYYDFQAYKGANGDGILLYPGKRYGVDGPVPSIRMEAIRDGLEEYEFIYKLKELYKESAAAYGVEIDAEKVLDRLYSDMYTGTKVSCSEANFEKNRARLIGLLNLNQTDGDICVTDIRDDSGSTYIDILAKNDCELQANGELVKTLTVGNGSGKIYTYSVASGQLNEFEFSYGGYSFSVSINSSAQNYNADYLFENEIITEHHISAKQSLVDASTVDASLTGKMLKLDFEAATFEDDQIVHLEDYASIRKIDATCDKLVFKIYNPTNEVISLKLGAEYGNDLGIFNVLLNTDLKPGMNDVSLNNLSGYNWSKIKYFNRLRLTFGKPEDSARTIYIADMTIYKL